MRKETDGGQEAGRKEEGAQEKELPKALNLLFRWDQWCGCAGQDIYGAVLLVPVPLRGEVGPLPLTPYCTPDSVAGRCREPCSNTQGRGSCAPKVSGV